MAVLKAWIPEPSTLSLAAVFSLLRTRMTNETERSYMPIIVSRRYFPALENSASKADEFLEWGNMTLTKHKQRLTLTIFAGPLKIQAFIHLSAYRRP